MPSALAILNLLVDRNLRHSGPVATAIQASSAEGMEALIRVTRPWLLPMTQAVAQADLEKVTMRSMLQVKDGGVRVALPAVQYDEEAFIGELVEAFADLELTERDARPCWDGNVQSLGRQLAAAALTAHARIADQALRQLVVALTPEGGDDMGAVEAGVSAVLRLLPGEVLTRLPEFMGHCAVQATDALVGRIKDAIRLLSSGTALTKKAAEGATTLAREGLYYFATARLKRRQAGGEAVRLKCDRPDAILELLEGLPFGFGKELAVQTMIQLGIWRSRPVDGKNPQSALSPNHENVLCARGKMLFTIEQARLWQSSGMLGAAVLGAVATTSAQRVEVVNALVKEEILNEEAGRSLLQPSEAYNLAWATSSRAVPTARRQKYS